MITGVWKMKTRLNALTLGDIRGGFGIWKFPRIRTTGMDRKLSWSQIIRKGAQNGRGLRHHI